MGYVKRVKKIYGNPSQKDKVLFKYDPVGQRAVRSGCICKKPIVCIPPSSTIDGGGPLTVSVNVIDGQYPATLRFACGIDGGEVFYL